MIGSAMKRRWIALSVIFIMFITGCHTSSENTPRSTSVVLGGDQFPECLVGIWEGENWAFKFEPDGVIYKMKHNLVWHLDLRDGTVFMEGPTDDTYASFVMGDCKTTYDPQTRNLSVRVFLDDYVIKLVSGTLHGHVEDFFTGVVSEDCQTWTVDWTTYGYLEGAEPPDRGFIDDDPEKLIFKKVDLDSIKKEYILEEE